jgi:hypothetical protein
MNRVENGAFCDAGHTLPHSVISKCRNGFTVHAHKKSAILLCTGVSLLSTCLILNCTQIGQYILGNYRLKFIYDPVKVRFSFCFHRTHTCRYPLYPLKVWLLLCFHRTHTCRYPLYPLKVWLLFCFHRTHTCRYPLYHTLSKLYEKIVENKGKIFTHSLK